MLNKNSFLLLAAFQFSSALAMAETFSCSLGDVDEIKSSFEFDTSKQTGVQIQREDGIIAGCSLFSGYLDCYVVEPDGRASHSMTSISSKFLVSVHKKAEENIVLRCLAKNKA